MKTLRALTRLGHFNICDPEEQAFAVNMFFEDSENSANNKTISYHIRQDRLPFEINGNITVEEAIEFFDEWKKTILYSSDEKENTEFITFIKTVEEDILDGNKKRKLEILKKKQEEINKQIELLED